MKLDQVLQVLYPTDFGPNIQIKHDEVTNELVIYYWNADKLGKQPTEQELLDQAPALQQQYDNIQINIARIAEYPSEHSLTIALWEAYVEGNHTELTKLQDRRLVTKAKYPKV